MIPRSSSVATGSIQVCVVASVCCRGNKEDYLCRAPMLNLIAFNTGDPTTFSQNYSGIIIVALEHDETREYR